MNVTPRYCHLGFSLHAYFKDLASLYCLKRQYCHTPVLQGFIYLTVYIMQLQDLHGLLQQSKDFVHCNILITLSWLLLFYLLTFFMDGLFLTGLMAPMPPSYHKILFFINHFACRSQTICCSDLACPTTLGLSYYPSMHPRHVYYCPSSYFLTLIYVCV